MNIKEFANIAGVSVATVSKILNNKDEGISGETRQRVLQLANEYRYTPYAGLKKSSTDNSYTFALVSDFSSPDYFPVMRGVEKGLQKNGYSLIVANHENSSDSLKRVISTLCGKNLNALILSSCVVCDNVISAIEKLDIPYFLVDTHPLRSSFGTIQLDYGAATIAALEQLYSYGHVKIGCILNKDNFYSKTVLDAYTKFCYDKAIPINSEYIYADDCGIEAGINGINKLVHYGITAVLCQDDTVSQGVVLASNQLGYDVPADMSVMGISISDRNCHEGRSVSSICIPMEEYGQFVAEKAISCIERRKKEPTSLLFEKSIFTPGNTLDKPRDGSNIEKNIAVIGSLNMDMMISTPAIPQQGETMISSMIAEVPGGKGGNQAVGVGKLGGKAYMIGIIGNDHEGKVLYQSLFSNNVNMDGVSVEEDYATGKAYIQVADSGESTIVVYPGANAKLTPSYIEQNRKVIESAHCCLISTETPIDTVEYVCTIAKTADVPVILKPAAVDHLTLKILDGLFILIPNEKELEHLIPDRTVSIENKAKSFLAKGVKNVIVTLGENGCMLCNEDEIVFFPAADFQAVDTTGAADSFISALSVALLETGNLHYAINYATYAAGVSITRQGVQPALPDKMTMRLYADKIKKDA